MIADTLMNGYVAFRKNVAVVVGEDRQFKVTSPFKRYAIS